MIWSQVLLRSCYAHKNDALLKLLSTETGSEDDGLLDLSEDDFFLSGSSSDEADADDEWTDKSTRYLSLSFSGNSSL